jgi:hypothetical protein
MDKKDSFFKVRKQVEDVLASAREGNLNNIIAASKRITGENVRFFEPPDALASVKDMQSISNQAFSIRPRWK